MVVRLLTLWDDAKFQVHSIEYGDGLIGLLGQHVESSFRCAVVGIYAPCTVHQRQSSWRNLIILKSAFDIPWVMIGDFNETLAKGEGNSRFINAAGSNDLKRFLDSCNLIEHALTGHSFTCFRGGSMSRIDRAFSSPECHSHFRDSIHGQLIVGNHEQDKGWKPLRFIECWLYNPQFQETLQSSWQTAFIELPRDSDF